MTVEHAFLYHENESTRHASSACEYAISKPDYAKVRREQLPKNYFFPKGMRFSSSDAIFPSGELRDMIAKEYEEQCRILCFRPHPTLEEGEEIFRELRADL